MVVWKGIDTYDNHKTRAASALDREAEDQRYARAIEAEVVKRELDRKVASSNSKPNPTFETSSEVN